MKERLAVIAFTLAIMAGCGGGSTPPVPPKPQPSSNIEWITIPAGEFVMGCADGDSECWTWESPKHTVYLSEYKIQKYEVTNTEYKACVDAGECTAPSSSSSFFNRPSYYGNTEYDNYPMIHVAWDQASAYCQWMEGRLPTEAEWEKAARGPSPMEAIYPWGNDTPTCAIVNYNDCKGNTDEVGSHPTGASYYGVMDMAGNVLEWVNDWYGEDYYSSSPASDPPGPSSGMSRVLRGGWWLSSASTLQVFSRHGETPGSANLSLGFRCAQD